jgi:DNA-binding SARP family transcriptional activator/tetratricopeptide (TPR) repeat protein
VIHVRDGRREDRVLLRLAGAFAVLRDGDPDPGSGLGSRKARAVLKVLAVQRGRLVPVPRLTELLWGDEPPRRPAENIATLVSRLRSTLGATAIVGGRDGYRLGAAPAIVVDLDEAASHVGEAERRLRAGEPAFAALAAGLALDLVGDGTALADEPDADWAEPARVEVAGLLRRARHAAAEAALDTGDPGAAGFAADAFTADPSDEVACRLLMRAHAARGEPARALAAYEQLRIRLETELGADPAPQTRELHLAILREDSLRPVPPSTPVGPARSSTLVGPAGSSTLVGRVDEQLRLEQAFAAAAGGQGGLVLIAGEAGIGKTRLAEQTVALADRLGAIVLRARCYDAERSLFLQPFAELLSSLVSRLSTADLGTVIGDHGPTLAGLVPALAGPVPAPAGPVPAPAGPVLAGPMLALAGGTVGTGGPGAGSNAATGDTGHAELERRRVFEAVSALLRGLTDRAPVLVFLDDLHSAGLSTIELLHFLARSLPGRRLLVVATIRVEEGQAALATLADVSARLDLGPLPADAVRALATEAGHAALAAEILRQTRGHALYVVELLRGLRAGQPGLPGTLQAAVLARVARAGAGIEELLRAAAVVGATLNPTVLARILDEPAAAVARRCEEALAARLLLVAGREYEFANDLIREVLYATTPEPTRVAHHLRAAELLDDQPEAVALHAAAAGDWGRAARAFMVAGEVAMGRFAVGDAHDLLDRALAAAHHLPPAGWANADRELVGRIHIARAKVREAQKQYEPALADLRAAVAAAREAGDRRLEMLALVQISGDVPIALGVSVAEGLTNLRRGLHIAESLADRGTEATLLGRLAALSANQLHLGDAVDYGRRAVAAGRAAGNERARAAGLDGLKTAHFFLGDTGLLAVVLDELEPLLRRAGDLFTLQWAVFESAFVPFGAGDWDAAAARMELAIETNRRSGFTAYEGWFTSHVAMLDQLRGRYDSALERGRHAVALANDSPHPWWLPTTHTLLAATLVATGAPEAAIPLLRRAREVAGVGTGAPAHLGPATALLAEVTGSADLLAEAAALLDGIRAPDGGAWLYGAETYLAVARGWLAHGEPQRARDTLAPMLAAAVRGPLVSALTGGLLVDAQAGLQLGDPAAPAQLDRAAALADRYGLVGVTELAGPRRCI